MKAAAARLDAAQWAKAAALAGGRRSGGECRCHWGAALAASRAPWTPQEHARMMVIAEAHAFANVRLDLAPCLRLPACANDTHWRPPLPLERRCRQQTRGLDMSVTKKEMPASVAIPAVPACSGRQLRGSWARGGTQASAWRAGSGASALRRRQSGTPRRTPACRPPSAATAATGRRARRQGSPQDEQQRGLEYAWNKPFAAAGAPHQGARHRLCSSWPTRWCAHGQSPCRLQVIAAEVGGGRSAANCLQRWSRRGLGTALKKGKWDEAEDQALLQVLQTRVLTESNRDVGRHPHSPL